MRLAVFLAGLSPLLASPAFAHVGDHSTLDRVAMIAHFFEADHIIFALIAVVTGVLAYRAGRRAEARVHAKREASHDHR